jgi:hypothetical protein
MSAPRSSAWILAANRRRAGYADLRISDAERAEVADLLSKHYGDGRLDQAEFNQRLDQAMRAKTYRDLTGLLADLPPTDTDGEGGGPGGTGLGGAEVAGRPRPGRRSHPILILAAAIAIAIILGHALTIAWTPWAWSFSPLGWIALAVLAVALLNRRKKRP